MSTFFTYSILQYKHNLVLGEVLNVGILFHFPKENKFEFVKGDGHRARSIYPDFDNSLFNAYIKSISDKVKKHVDIFSEQSDKTDFSLYIQKNILAEDAAGLVFKAPVQVKAYYDTIQTVVNEYSKLLLPGINIEKPNIIKHNEQYIIKTFQSYFQDKYKAIENKIIKNKSVRTAHFDIKFDLSFVKGVQYLIKPISFDLSEENAIQTKAATIYGHLSELKEYAKTNKSEIEFLISKPQDKKFIPEYENALDLIDGLKASKLFTEDKWESHTQNIYDLLFSN